MWKLKSLTHQKLEMVQLLSVGVILSNPADKPDITLKYAEHDHEFCASTYDWYFSRWGPIAIEHYAIFLSLINPYPIEEWSQSSELESLSEVVRSHVNLQSSSTLVYEAFHCMKPARPPENLTWLDKATPVVIQLAFDQQYYEFRAFVTEDFIPLLKRARSGAGDSLNSTIVQEYSARVAGLTLSSKEISQLSIGDVLLFSDIRLDDPIGCAVRFGDLVLSPCRVRVCDDQYQIIVLNHRGSDELTGQ